MNQYAIYLRKSRADMEAEARGEGETLARHRVALRALAERRGLNVVHEYAELVTGDSIAARPQMQALLEDVKRGMYAGVIVNDVDRLGRGDSIDQEIIKYTFSASHCLIITPGRDIDPASPSDQDMLDFSMFFARFEYRKISQRLMQGRTRSAASGNFICARVPYGYRKVTEGKNIKLEPDPDTAPIVKMIFDKYASGSMGYMNIAAHLNAMGLKTYRGFDFDRATVKKMLQNPVYTGRILWGKTSTVSVIENGRRVKRQISAQPTVIENAHPAIVSDETFDKVQQMFSDYRHASPVNSNKITVNPVAGLVYCSICGRLMQLHGGKNNKRILTCFTRGCPTSGTHVANVTNALLDTLRDWCAEYETPPLPKSNQAEDSKADVYKRQLATIESQLAKAQELVELGVYTPSEYLDRRNALQERMEAVKKEMQNNRDISMPNAIRAQIPAIRRVLEALPNISDVEQQNKLFKTVVSRIDYNKTKAATRGISPESLLSITVYPRIGSSM